MRATLLLLLGCLTCVGGCTAKSSSEPAPPVVVGGDSDVHGCKASAGYTWCARENKCVRPWELARQKGFDPAGDGFKRYCAGGS